MVRDHVQDMVWPPVFVYYAMARRGPAQNVILLSGVDSIYLKGITRSDDLSERKYSLHF